MRDNKDFAEAVTILVFFKSLIITEKGKNFVKY